MSTAIAWQECAEKDPARHAGAYWQLSYTRQKTSRTEYVRQESVAEIRRLIATHKRFKQLVDQWVDLCIEHSRLTVQKMPRERNCGGELGTLKYRGRNDFYRIENALADGIAVNVVSRSVLRRFP